MPFERPRQPKRVYSRGGPRIGGRFNSFAKGATRMFGRGLASGIRGLSSSGYKKQQAKKSSNKFSSAYFKKNPYMQKRKAKSIVSGMRGSRDQKILAELRLENQTYDPKQKKEPDFSWNEGNQTVARVRKIYGDKIAKEVEKKLHGAFRGKHTISGREAQKHLMGVSQYGKDVREGISLIAQNFDKKYQGDSASNYITEEKLENIIKETAKTNKYAAHSLREEFMVTTDEQQNKAAIAGNSGLGSLAKRVADSLRTREAKRETGSTTGSSSGNTMVTREARQESTSRSSSNSQASSPSLSQADLNE